MANTKLELTWLGKGDSPQLEPRLLLLQPEHCHGDPNAENLLIHGDNLLALKALEQEYAGKVKCIYIDPPYNTGSAFEHYDDGVEHSVWLNLMYHRLVLLRNLLAEDGSIWVTLDDNEVHYCKVVMDEIFGRKNFVGSVVWQKRTSPEARYRLGAAHDHILVFGKDAYKVKNSLNQLPVSDSRKNDFKNPDNDPNGPWASVDFTGMAGHATPSQFYTITSPTGIKHTPPPGRCWAIAERNYLDLVKEGKVWFGNDGNAKPRLKRYLFEVEGQNAWSWWTNSEVGHNQEAKKEIIELFGSEREVFATPKPERLIERILTLATSPGDLVLDSFLGSGTTAAVAHKMGRRWIGIELGEHAYTHCVPRLRKVVAGQDPGGITKAQNWAGGGGFKTCRLAESLLERDEAGMLRFNPDFTDEMVAEAVAKIEGYRYTPAPEVFWKQGQSSEKDYLYVTKIFVTRPWLEQLAGELAADESLLVCCPAYGAGCERAFTNINLKKIPQAFMARFEWDRDDYSLNVENVLPEYEEAGAEPDDAARGLRSAKKDKKPKDEQPTLF